MSPPADSTLLDRYARQGDAAAFDAFMRRHLDLVYSAALRQTAGDHHRAQEITQTVFLTAARRARLLSGHVLVTGWLHRTTRHVAADLRRAETRRRRHETTQAAEAILLMENQPSDAPVSWDLIGPLLDAALDTLGDKDRETVLLRYFAQKPFADIAASLGTTEAAAQMRAARALEKLRRALAKRGVTSTASALGLALTGHAVTASPASVATSTLVALGTASSATATLSTFLSMSLLKHAATGLACATLGGFAVHHFATAPAMAPTATAPAPLAPADRVTPPPATASPDPRLAELAAENADLRDRLAATETDRDSTRDQLAELRRPMHADLISSTLSATVQPGETIVTGGSLLPDGKRLFVFATPTHSSDQGRTTVEVRSRFLALPDEAVARLGLEKLSTSAANTLQHGEVWAPGEMDTAFAKLDQSSGADTLSAPGVRLLSGNEGAIGIGQEGGESLQMKVRPKLAADGRALEMELRMELAPATPPPPASEIP
jgi:RNA polymerase sigma factor (sigma-70 family)